MHTSSAGLRLIEEFEGFRPSLYNDPAGDCTIGFGTLVHIGPQSGETSEWPYLHGISRAEAEHLLQDHVWQIEDAIGRLVKVTLNQPQFDALVAFIYNVGVGTFGRSTLLQKLNCGEYAAVPAELLRYVHAGGKPGTGAGGAAPARGRAVALRRGHAGRDRGAHARRAIRPGPGLKGPRLGPSKGPQTAIIDVAHEESSFNPLDNRTVRSQGQQGDHGRRRPGHDGRRRGQAQRP